MPYSLPSADEPWSSGGCVGGPRHYALWTREAKFSCLPRFHGNQWTKRRDSESVCCCVLPRFSHCLLDILYANDSQVERRFFLIERVFFFLSLCARPAQGWPFKGTWPHHTPIFRCVRGWTRITSPANPWCHLSTLDMSLCPMTSYPNCFATHYLSEDIEEK